MNYNLTDALPLNFNYVELKQQSINSADILVLLYLHLKYLKKVSKFETVVKRLNLCQYPTFKYRDYAKRDVKTKKLVSIFTLERPVSRLNYINILWEDIDDYERVTYLKLVSMLPPYSSNKVIPKNLVSSVPSSLIVCGLIKPVEAGYALLKERGE